MISKSYYVYILASSKNGTLYTGVTNNLVGRVYTHKTKLMKGFSQKYRTQKLVYYEIFESIENAIMREKQIKRWKRNWKIELIENKNPNWNDLYFELN